MLLAEAGIPVVLLAMPTQGSTAPATLAGAMVVGDAEVISATVLLQLIAPGSPVSHSIMHAKIDPRTGGYVPYPLDHRGQYMMVDIAHHWGMSCFGGAFGTEAPVPGTWQAAAEVAFDPLLIGMAGAEWVTGMGLNRNFTLLYPEAIIYDDEIYHKARYALAEVDISPETMALDVIDKVGPGGHYLSQKHTRDHLRATWNAGIRHQLTPDGKYRDPGKVALEKAAWILENHKAEPIDENKQKEMSRILASADKELNKD
jgi:trimethylamine--corrinoid protein Co-methyltransferase